MKGLTYSEYEKIIIKTRKKVTITSTMKPDRDYYTRGSELGLHFLPLNRGLDSGVDMKKVNSINKVKDELLYYKLGETILINDFDEIIEGVSRAKSAMMRNEVFIIKKTDEPAFNHPDLNERLNAISDYNSLLRSYWTAKIKFRSAVKAGIPLAIIIDDYLTNKDNNYVNVGGSYIPILSSSQIYNCINHCKSVVGNNSMTRRHYCDTNLYKYAITDEGKELVANVLKISKAYREKYREFDVRAFAIIKRLFELVLINGQDANAQFKYIVKNIVSFNKSIKATDGKDGVRHYNDYATKLYEYANNTRIVEVKRKLNKKSEKTNYNV